MSATTTTFRRSAASVLACCAIAAPAAQAVPAENGPVPPSPITATDLRSPDARDAAAGIGPSSPAVDLRSPDTRDAAAGVSPSSVGLPGVVEADDGGFDWSTAGLTAGIVLGLLVLAGTGLGVLRHGRSRVAA